MIKILAPIALSILIIGCSSDKEPITPVKEEDNIVVQEETVSKPGELTELDKCLSRVGMSRETTTSDMSLIDVASNEIMVMDRDTHMGTDYEGYDHECLDLYLEYIRTTDYDNVAENTDMEDTNSDGQDNEFDATYEDVNYDTVESLEFDVSVAPVLYKTYENERYQTQITIISKNDNPVTLTDIIINRGNIKNCSPYGPTSNLNKNMSFGDKVSVMLWHTCEVSDIIEVGINTTSGELVYTF